jgi:hypothetical protein
MRSYMDENRLKFDSHYANFMAADKVIHEDQVRRMRKVNTGYDLEKGERYKITGKVYSKQAIDQQDDSAMADILACYWASRRYRELKKAARKAAMEQSHFQEAAGAGGKVYKRSRFN